MHSLIYLGVIGFVYYCFYGLYTNSFLNISAKTMQVIPSVLSYVLFISSFVLIHLTFSEISIVERLTGSRKVYVISFLITFALFVTSSTLYIPSLFLLSVVNEDFSYGNNKELFVLIIGFAIIFFMYSLAAMAGMKFVLSQFDKKLKISNGEYFYIQENDTSEKWYVYYPTNNNLYLLGDTPLPQKTNVFKTMDKKELLAQKIYVHRSNDEEEAQ